MRAVIDATALGSGRGGDETMLLGVVRGLAAVGAAEDRFTVLADVGQRERIGPLSRPTVQFEAMARRPGPRTSPPSCPGTWPGAVALSTSRSP